MHDFDPTPSSLTLKIYYSDPSYGLTGASSLSGQGGVTFKVNGAVVTAAEPGATVTATAVALDGYTATLASIDATIGADGTFTMPSKAVTVTANYAELATGGTADLDLEAATADVPSGTTIDQYYIKTTGSKTTTYNRIKVSWVNQSIGVKVADAKVWNHASLAWEADSGNSGAASVSRQSGMDIVKHSSDPRFTSRVAPGTNLHSLFHSRAPCGANGRFSGSGNAGNPIALAMPRCSGLEPQLPGRVAA